MIELDKDSLIVTTPRGTKNSEVKNVLGGRWSKPHEAWRIRPISLNVLTLVEWYGEEILEGAPEEIRDLASEPWGFRGFTDEEREVAENHPSWARLYPHQREGVEYLFCNPHAASLVALSWGLGKGATAVVAADLLKATKVLVLAPLTLGPTWVKEYSEWSEEGPANQMRRARPEDPLPGPGWTVTNHEMLRETVLRDENGEILDVDWASNARKVKEWIQDGPLVETPKGKIEPARKRIPRVRREYLEADWDLIIVDESVLLKNRKAIKTDLLTTLRKVGSPHVFQLSASPTTKYRDDLYKQMKILYPKAFPSYWRFAEFFCVVDKDGWGWSIEGDKPNVDPKHYLRDLMWVKSEKDVELDLPEYIEMEMRAVPGPRQQKALLQMVDDWKVELEKEDPDALVASNWLSRSVRLQQITSNMGSLPKPSGGFYRPESSKENLLIDMIQQGELAAPLLVWAWFKRTAQLLGEAIEKTGLTCAVVTGDLDTKNKDRLLEGYKSGVFDALVLQIGVGKFGHTLTDTRSIFYHDRTFDTDAYLQSRRRVRRIGLKHRPTLVVPKLVGSADDLIDENLSDKVKSIAQLTNADLAEFLKTLT